MCFSGLAQIKDTCTCIYSVYKQEKITLTIPSGDVVTAANHHILYVHQRKLQEESKVMQLRTIVQATVYAYLVSTTLAGMVVRCRYSSDCKVANVIDGLWYTWGLTA